MYYFKKVIKDWRELFEMHCSRKILYKSWLNPEIIEPPTEQNKRKWLYELFQEEKLEQTRCLHEKLNKNEQFLEFLTKLLETLYFLIDFLGTDFKEEPSGLLFDCYNYFVYSIKGVLILQEFFTKTSKNKQFGSYLTPTLSRLNTKDYSHEIEKHLSRKFSRQYEKIACQNMEECFKYLYFKMSAVIAQFMKEKPENLNKFFVHYIKNSPSPLALSSEIKFSYLKWQSILKAKKSCPVGQSFQDFEDNDLVIKIKREEIWQSTFEYLVELDPWELALRHIKINFENEIGSDFGFKIFDIF